MKTLKIKFVKSGIRFSLGYVPGEIASIEEKQSQELINAGVAVLVAEDVDPNPLPSDMPGRKELFDAGIETLIECHKIVDFSEINGIGKALSIKIKKYINTEK